MEFPVSGWTDGPRRGPPAAPTFQREVVGLANQDMQRKYLRTGSVALG